MNQWLRSSARMPEASQSPRTDEQAKRIHNTRAHSFRCAKLRRHIFATNNAAHFHRTAAGICQNFLDAAHYYVSRALATKKP